MVPAWAVVPALCARLGSQCCSRDPSGAAEPGAKANMPKEPAAAVGDMFSNKKLKKVRRKKPSFGRLTLSHELAWLCV